MAVCRETYREGSGGGERVEGRREGVEEGKSGRGTRRSFDDFTETFGRGTGNELGRAEGFDV